MRHVRDAEFISVLLADGTCIWTDESTLRVEHESERGIVVLCPCTQESKLLHEIETIRGPRTGQEDEVKELHAPANDGDPFKTFLQNDADISVSVHKVSQAPGIPPVCIDLVVRNEDRLLRKLERQDSTVATSYSDVVNLILGKSARAVQFEGYGETSRRKRLGHQDEKGAKRASAETNASMIDGVGEGEWKTAKRKENDELREIYHEATE